jgi:tetratricopeptide (TPR) repeat protein
MLVALACPVALRSAEPATRTDGLAGLIATADRDYRSRADLANVQRGLRILRQVIEGDPNNYDSWWRISRSENYLGRKEPNDNAAGRDYQLGIDAGRKAVALRPNQVEGHFWLGANCGLLAETEGWIKGLRLIDTVRAEMETVMRLDPQYEEAAGQRTLARLYYLAPFFKGGDKQRSILLLQDCLRRFPNDSFAMLYLADDYVAVGRRDEARSLLEHILDLRGNPADGPELADNQAEARDRLRGEFRTGK